MRESPRPEAGYMVLRSSLVKGVVRLSVLRRFQLKNVKMPSITVSGALKMKSFISSRLFESKSMNINRSYKVRFWIGQAQPRIENR